MTPISPCDLFVRLPCVKQLGDYDCGAACVESILTYTGKPADQKRLLKALGTHPKHGTEPEAISTVLTQAGIGNDIEEHLERDDIEEHLDKGAVVMLSMRARGDEHWMVAVGHKETALYVMDPVIADPCTYGIITWKELAKHWTATDRRGRRRDGLGIIVDVEAKQAFVGKRVPVP